jgi:hypothetical protein
MRVHQIWVGGDMPAHRRQFAETVRAVGGSRYRLWGNDDIAALPLTSACLARRTGKLPWAMVADMMRMEIVHRHGGAYFDTNIEVLRPRELRAKLAGIPAGILATCNAETYITGGISNSFFATPAPGHPALGAMVAAMCDFGDGRVLRPDLVTGQRFFGRHVRGRSDVVAWPRETLYPYVPRIWNQDRCIRWGKDGRFVNMSGWNGRGSRFGIDAACAGRYPGSLAVNHWDLGGSWAPRRVDRATIMAVIALIAVVLVVVPVVLLICIGAKRTGGS